MSLQHHWLLENFHYDPDTGQWTRLKSYNGRGPTGPVSPPPNSAGYMRVTINNKSYLLHRLAWFYVNGLWPPEIDHENNIRVDNRFTNLRYATHADNLRNTKKNRVNTSGYKGVYLDKKRMLFVAQMKISKGVCKYLGSFTTAKEAHEAYCEAAKKIHGGFFNAG